MRQPAATVPLWMTQTTPRGPATTYQSSDCFDGPALAEAVYGPALGCDSGLTAFAYCWRRFGPPWGGADPDKALAAYKLGTPHEEVVLWLNLRATPLAWSVGCAVTRAFEEAWLAPDPSRRRRLPNPVQAEAITAALIELLRPVWIGEVPITILGRLLMVDDAIAPAPPSPYAGYGVPRAAMEALLHNNA